MTDRDPYLVLRDFRVWFPKRLGFLAGLRKSEPAYVRAVDGLDLEIGKGEVYCLVGESGCGKTTTGKGILRLVEPTGGDVLVGMSREDLRQYDNARQAKDEATIEAIRRKWSLTYRPTVHRTRMDLARQILAVLAGLVVGGLAAAGILIAADAFGLGGWALLAPVVQGILLGFLGTIPWLKVTRRVPVLLMLASVPSVVFAQFLMLWVQLIRNAQPSDLGSVWNGYVQLWEGGTIGVTFFSFVLAALVAWYAGRTFTRHWQRRQGFSGDRVKKMRKSLQIIFQDPYESLNPKNSVYDTVAEPLIVNHLARGRDMMEPRVERALDDAGLRPPRDFMFRFPHELSGGQRQRVSIAGALVLEPDFIVADEPVSMLDVSIRTEIIELLLELRRQKGLTYLFITHDLSLAWVLADRVAVMYLGRIVEEGPTREVIRNAQHPYTKALISVVPVPDPDRRRQRIILKGERPDPSDIPPGCRFHPRCPVAIETCGWTAAEVAADLRHIAQTASAGSPGLDALVADNGLALRMGSGSEGAEAWIREQVANRAEEYRSFKAVRSIEREGETLSILLHEGAEPLLKSVSANSRVACHLVG